MPSRQLAMFLLLTHAGAVLLISLLLLPPGVIFVLAGAVVVSLYSNLRRFVGLRSKFSIVEAVWDSDGEWMLLSAHGEAMPAALLPNMTMYSALVMLHFRLLEARGTRSLILTRDSLDRKTFRHLRVRLQMEPPQ